jgi:hypothetical protein
MANGDGGEVRREDIEGDEAWQRLTDEPEIRGIEAIRNDDPAGWQVTVWAMEFVREEPLESTVRRVIGSALRAVPGVDGVAEEDREVWWITGAVSGEALTRSAAAAVDELADQLRAWYDQLG